MGVGDGFTRRRHLRFGRKRDVLDAVEEIIIILCDWEIRVSLCSVNTFTFSFFCWLVFNLRGSYSFWSHHLLWPGIKHYDWLMLLNLNFLSFGLYRRIWLLSLRLGLNPQIQRMAAFHALGCFLNALSVSLCLFERA